jgi:hypothetical protein
MRISPTRSFFGTLLAAAAVTCLAGTADAVTSYEIVSVVVPARVLPNGTLPAAITLRNTGNTTWQVGRAALVFGGDATAWPNANLPLPTRTAPTQQVTFSGTLRAGTQIGRHQLLWQPTIEGASVGTSIPATVELTCSDGIYCNGEERFVNGKCANDVMPCDDGEACTTDACDEATRLCSHVGSPGCDQCFAKNCVPKCKGVACGDDGCGGSCGLCAFGQACDGGTCIVAVAPGTCSNPISLTDYPVQIPQADALLGLRVLQGDTTNGFNETIPTCNATSTAPETIYTFTVGTTVGIDARSSDFDTVLSLRKDGCVGTTVACSDDAAPPGNYGSHVTALLQPGTYYLVVDGFDESSYGPFTLYVNLVSGCVPQCDGKFCGDDGCGGSCGRCDVGQVCNTSARCVDSPCQPQCNGRKCGDDGCGGSCGTCKTGELCVTETGACKSFPTCNHELPTCKTNCSSRQFCGVDCECHDVRDAMPDLVVDRTRLQNEILLDTLDVSPTSCTIAEQCVGAPGVRKLLRFSVEAVNQGQGDLEVPSPAKRPDLFAFSGCHGHYHFSGFAQYRLLDIAGHVVQLGKKLAYCMEDTVQVMEGPGVSCTKQYDCENQGIQAGWSDLYGNSLDCQWLDVTDVPPGLYNLEVTVNPTRAFPEETFDNNTTTVPVVIP